MKKLLGILAVVFVLNFASQAAAAVTLVGYWTGAWYETGAPKGSVRGAGQIDIYQWSDGTLDYDLYFDGEIFKSGEGLWSLRGKKYKVTFNDEGGLFSYRRFFRGGGSTYFWSGTFSLTDQNGRYKGRWQTT